MKVFARKKPIPIEDRLADEILSEENEYKEVICITLDYDEFKEFQTFMRRTMMSATYQGKYTYLFMGVSVLPNRAAVERLDKEWGETKRLMKLHAPDLN